MKSCFNKKNTFFSLLVTKLFLKFLFFRTPHTITIKWAANAATPEPVYMPESSIPLRPEFPSTWQVTFIKCNNPKCQKNMYDSNPKNAKKNQKIIEPSLKCQNWNSSSLWILNYCNKDTENTQEVVGSNFFRNIRLFGFFTKLIKELGR